jgi:predicted nuclease of predicted toxin-antitoxin system
VRIKADENIGQSAIDILRRNNYDVSTVQEQGLTEAPDEQIFHACTTEKRVLIRLDRDFGQVRRFPPSQSAGLVVLEFGGPASTSRLHARIREFRTLAETRSVHGQLWVVEPGRIRVHLENDDES